MIVLEPVIHETIWGGSRIGQYYDIGCANVGHLYMINGHKDMSNIVLNGPDKGKTLYEIYDRQKIFWGMEEFEEFPLTIALVDATKNLSIQVHPDETIAEMIEGKRVGKIESWIFLESPLDGWIYGGCKCESLKQVKLAVADKATESVTAHFPVEQMDCVTVENGTLHAMTEGSLVYEIEYGSDITYRFYDYDRLDKNGNGRPLHVEQAFKSIDVDRVPIRSKICWGSEICNDKYGIRLLKEKNYYRNESKEIECISILNGSGCIDEVEISSGMSFLMFPGEEVKDIYFHEMIISYLIR